jgi:uncharacterized membrane protein YccF (DUF307 family)
MPLRLRLTLLYSIFMGGILLIFGMAVYFVVNFILITQVDNTLASVARELIRNVSINPVGELIVVRQPMLIFKFGVLMAKL